MRALAVAAAAAAPPPAVERQSCLWPCFQWRDWHAREQYDTKLQRLHLKGAVFEQFGPSHIRRRVALSRALNSEASCSNLAALPEVLHGRRDHIVQRVVSGCIELRARSFERVGEEITVPRKCQPPLP